MGVMECRVFREGCGGLWVKDVEEYEKKVAWGWWVERLGLGLRMK